MGVEGESVGVVEPLGSCLVHSGASRRADASFSGSRERDPRLASVSCGADSGRQP
jgi:hypothetical protein